MSNQPFMQLYVGDYLADTLHLTTEQHGAYMLLLMTMWRHGAKLPNDPAKLARICRTTPRKWPAIWAELEGFFTVEGDSIVNGRLTKEHQKAKAKSELRADAGSHGGKAKALKDKEARLANASDLPQHSSEPEVRKKEVGKPTSVHPGFSPSDFEDFWAAYPHRNGKKKNRKGAEAAFARAIKAGATVPEIAAGVNAAQRDPDVLRGYARDPTTWLNQRGWTDEIPEPFAQIPGGLSDRTHANGTTDQHRGASIGPQASGRGQPSGIASIVARRRAARGQ